MNPFAQKLKGKFSGYNATGAILPLVLCLSILISQTYRLRFQIFGLNSNFLMLYLGLVILFFGPVVIYNLSATKKQGGKNSKHGLYNYVNFATLMLIASSISLIVANFQIKPAGLYIAYFVQPIIIGLLAHFVTDRAILKKLFWTFTGIVLLFNGILTLIQYHTLEWLNPQWWGNLVEPKRATGIFNHPNTLALFCVPLLSAMLPVIFKAWQNKQKFNFLLLSLAWLLGATEVFLSLSRAGWLALVVCAGLFALINLKWKYLLAAALGATIIILTIWTASPIIRYRVISSSFKDTSTSARPLLWQAGLEVAKENPIFGIGLGGFEKRFNSLKLPENLNTHASPHNVFLHFWLETGLVGVLAFICLALVVLRRFLERRSLDDEILGLFMLAFLIHGLFDVAYFRNDLALVFWLTLGVFWRQKKLL